MTGLETAVNKTRTELTWFARCRDVYPELDSSVKDWQTTIPAELVPACLAAHVQHYRDLSTRLRAEVNQLERVVRDAHRAAQALVDAVPAQGKLL